MPFQEKYPFSDKIAEEIREGIMLGIKISVIHDNCLRLQACPRSKNGFVDKYKEVIAEARLEYQKMIAGIANQRMMEGSDAVLTLALRSKLGWNPSTKIEDVKENTDEETSSLDTLKRLLKVEEPDSEDSKGSD